VLSVPVVFISKQKRVTGKRKVQHLKRERRGSQTSSSTIASGELARWVTIPTWPVRKKARLLGEYQSRFCTVQRIFDLG
jgi:hypothetical protein